MRPPFQSPQVFVVSASAGSGKTYALAKRYIQILFYLSASNKPLSAQHLLAITFTNKAAHQMKSRILYFLKRTALNQLSDSEFDDILKPLEINRLQAAEQARRIMWELIRHYHYFQVKTIDSFINALLAGCAFKIGLSARFKIKRNAVDYIQQSMDALLDAAMRDKTILGLFHDFIDQYLFLENRGGWFAKEDLLKLLADLFNKFNTYQKDFLTSDIPVKDIYLLKKEFLGKAQVLLETSEGILDGRFSKSLRSFLEQSQQSFDVDDLSDYFKRTEIPARKSETVSRSQEELWDKCRSLLRLIVLAEAYSIYNPYVRLFEALMEQMGVIKRKDDILFLQELNRTAGGLFNEKTNVQELYYRLATRFEHYLIDEFQDTSRSQWRNLETMVEDGLSTGGTLFYVGDPKQAIYAFRGGESSLFKSLKQDLADYHVQEQVLSTNYRSRQRIVAFNNEVFSLDNLNRFYDALTEQAIESKRKLPIDFDEHDRDMLAQTFGQAEQQSRADLPGGYVRVVTIDAKTKSTRNEMVQELLMGWITEVRQRYPLGDIAILTRDNGQVQEVTGWLLDAGIAVQSERTSDIKAYGPVNDLIAFLTFLSSPIDNIAFAQFLLGDLAPKALGIDSETLRQFLFESAPNRQATESYIYRLFRRRFPEVWERVIDPFFVSVGIYPLYETVVSIYARFECQKHFPEGQGFWMHLLELIKRYEEEGCDIEGFLNDYANLENEARFVPINPTAAIRVLTVHKAKGLEFPVVLLPYLEMDIKPGAGGKQGSQSYTVIDEEQGMQLVRLKQSYTGFSDELKAQYIREYKSALLGELHVAYVALTRAVHEMYVAIPSRSGQGANPAILLIDQHLYTCGNVLTVEHTPDHQEQRFLSAIEFTDWLPKLREEFSNEDDRALRRRKGDFIHWAFSQLGVLSQANVHIQIQEASMAAIKRFGPLLSEKDLIDLMTNTVHDPQYQAYFFLKQSDEVLREVPVVDAHGRLWRMDRLIISDKTITVIDYKTSSEDALEVQQRQLNHYMDLVKPMYPGYKVTGAIVYIHANT